MDIIYTILTIPLRWNAGMDRPALWFDDGGMSITKLIIIIVLYDSDYPNIL